MLTRSEEEKELVRDRRVSRLERRWYLRTLISVYLVFHLCAVAIWLLPGQSGINHGLAGLVRPYMTYTGLNQNWQMFSPNPDGIDSFMAATITLANGTTSYYEFPRIAKMHDYLTKYREERYRKFVENARANSVIWPCVAVWVTKRYSSQHPVTVVLYKYHRVIPAPGGGAMGPFLRDTLYTYNVATGVGK